MYGVKERLTKIHAVDIEAIEKRYGDMLVTLKTEKADLDVIIKDKEKTVEAERKELERVKGELVDRIKERDGRIKQLTDRLKDTDNLNAGELKNLHQSFHKIESEKELMTNEYQTNVGFLNQQVAKLASSN